MCQYLTEREVDALCKAGASVGRDIARFALSCLNVTLYTRCSLSIGGLPLRAMRSVDGCTSALRRCLAGTRRPASFHKIPHRGLARRLDVHLRHCLQPGMATQARGSWGTAMTEIFPDLAEM